MSFYAPFSRVSRRSHPFFPSIQQDLAPIFGLFNELESASRSAVRAFQPRFDVREEKDAFHLQGELPGIEQKDISIEFVDPTTLVVRGRTVKETQSGTPASATIEGSETKAIENTEGTETPQSETASNYQRPSIEEERDEAEVSTVGAPTPATTVAESVQAESEQPQVAQKTTENDSHYWVNERSVGEFHRSFNFPGQIDQDAVTASLKNGILSVVVPKQQPRQPRKITVQ